MSTYDPNIPLATDDLDVSQNDILLNFQQLDTTYGKNHFEYSDNTLNNGKHKFVQITEGNLPAGLVGGDETLYAKKVGSPVQGELFFTRGASGKQIQMTCGPNATVPTSTANGITFLPGGLLVQWGQVSGLSGSWPSGTQTLTFPVAFPTACFQVITNFTAASASSSSTGELVVIQTNAADFRWGFTGASGANFTGFFWWAIGN